MKRNWIDDHFREVGPTRLREVPPEVPSSRSWLAWVAMTGLLAGGSVVGADYAGLIHLGLFSQPESPAIVRVEDPQPIKQTVFVQPQPSELPTPPEPAVIAVAAPIIDPARERRLRDKIAQCDRGVDLISREMIEVKDQREPLVWEVTIRLRPTPPYSAAERLKNIADYAAGHPNMQPVEARTIMDYQNAARADYANAQRRIGELNEREQSLAKRLAAAAAEKKRAQDELLASQPTVRP